MNFPFRGQKDTKDCGPSCLSRILKFHGVNNIGLLF